MRLLLAIALTLSLTLSFTSCASVAQVSVKSGVGEELRPDTSRQSIGVGPVVKLQNGVKLDAKYRYRVEDWAASSSEHGFFMGVSVPVWTNKKR